MRIAAASAILLAMTLGACATQQTPGANAPAAAAATAQAAAPAARADKDDPNRLICRDEPVPGSKMSKRVCMTARERDQKTAEAREQLREIQGRAVQPTSYGGSAAEAAAH